MKIFIWIGMGLLVSVVNVIVGTVLGYRGATLVLTLAGCVLAWWLCKKYDERSK